jgi:hypothetical protein
VEVNVELHAQAVLPLEKEPPLPIVEEAGWAPEPAWTLWRKEKSLAPTGNGTVTPRSVQLVVKSLYRLSYLGSLKLCLWSDAINVDAVQREIVNLDEMWAPSKGPQYSKL